MKTVEEFYKEIAASKELQEELKNAYHKKLESFLKKQTVQQMRKNLRHS